MKKIKGFSIIEGVIAIFLALLFSLFVFTVFPSIRKGIHHSEIHVNAAIVGQNLLSQARRTEFDNVKPYSGSVTYEGMDNGRRLTQIFNYSLDVQTPEKDKKLVWATVTWNQDGKTRKVVLETYLVKLKG